MFFDAFRAELLKVMRNRVTTFWAYAFFPLLLLGLSVVFSSGRRPAVLDVATPVGRMMDGLASPTNVFGQVLLLVGAASIFAGEYRLNTWRLIVPRAGRSAIMLAKLAVFSCFAMLSVALSGLSGFLVGAYEMAFLHRPARWPPPEAILPAAMALQLFTSFLLCVLFAGLVMLAGVVTRSQMGATITAFLVLIALNIASTQVAIQDLAWYETLIPHICQFGLRMDVNRLLADDIPLDLHIGPRSAAILAGEAALLIAAALWLFRRQDLSEE